MKKGMKKINISAIKKKYFFNNPEITNDQIQKLLNTSHEFLSSITLNYDQKIKGNILQSIVSLVFLNHIPIIKEEKEKE